MPGRQSPHIAIPGKMREYCLRTVGGHESNDPHVWAMDAAHAFELYRAQFYGLSPARFHLHVSTVRRIEDETAETLRDIPS